MEKLMTKLKLLFSGLIAATMLTAPAVARENHMNSRHVVERVDAVPGSAYVDGQACQRAPRVGAFATQPWDNNPPCEPAPGY
jgi:hypothetical protein